MLLPRSTAIYSAIVSFATCTVGTRHSRGRDCTRESQSWLKNLVASAAAIVLAGLIVFQVLLAAGYPLGNAAWGGYYTELPAGLRIASLFSATLYAAFILVAFAAARVVNPVWTPLRPFGSRGDDRPILSGTLMNLASRRLWERAIMTPLALILTVCFISLRGIHAAHSGRFLTKWPCNSYIISMSTRSISRSEEQIAGVDRPRPQGRGHRHHAPRPPRSRAEARLRPSGGSRAKTSNG